MRKKLYLEAKKEKKFRFYALYDRLYRKDVLAAAWTQVKRNGGTCGVDGVRIEMIRETLEIGINTYGMSWRLSTYERTLLRQPEEKKQQGKPDAGKPHVRFDEGEASRPCWAGTSLLYSTQN